MQVFASAPGVELEMRYPGPNQELVLECAHRVLNPLYEINSSSNGTNAAWMLEMRYPGPTQELVLQCDPL